MSAVDTLHDIILLCHSIDDTARIVYAEFSELFPHPEIAGFWEEMSLEERQHVDFWEKLIQLSNEKTIPQIFENVDKVKSELSDISRKVEKLEYKFKDNPQINTAFSIAYRLEFYLLHPAFETLFHFASEMENIMAIQTPENSYEVHIRKFITGLDRFGKVTPEMELLGETLIRLWEENRHLVIQGNTDVLTTNLNRRGFFQVITPLAYFARRNDTQIGILLIDIDCFKEINDSHGHPMGDELLVRVGRLLRSSTRKSDICARLGGDEFIIFLSKVEKRSLEKIAEKIRRRILEENPCDLDITISIGAVDGPVPYDVEAGIKEFIRVADACLYKAKKQGRDRVVYNRY